MIKLNIKNCFKVDSQHGFSEKEFQNQAEKLKPFLQKIENRKQDFYKIFKDKSFLEEVKHIEKFSKSVKGKYEEIVVCGIGGSALGTITLKDSLSPLFGKNNPHLHVLENIDPNMMAEILDHIKLEKTLFIVVSKSGGTPEPVSQYFYFKNILKKSGLNIQKHFVIVTGLNGFLRSEVEKYGYESFTVPNNIGGRFSVLTSVGLLPASLIGIDIRGLLKGGKEMAKLFLSKNFEKNLPFQLATTQFLSQKPNQVLMPYATKLRTFTGWFAQLLAESTGKINLQGENVGMTPIPAVGATDQHSQLQLFAEGPNDKLIIFIRVENFSQNPEIPVLVENEKTDFLKGKTFQELLLAEQKGTSESLTEKNRPNITIEIDKISAETLGTLFLLFEGATAFIGEYLEVNAFNQPGVERSKILTRKNL